MGRKAKPWYRRSHGAWYATVNGERTHLVTGPKETTEAEAHEVFRRRTGTRGDDPRVQQINWVLAERPEWIDVVRVVLGVREDVATFGRSLLWFEMVREAMDGLAAAAVEANRSSNRLEPARSGAGSSSSVSPPEEPILGTPPADPVTSRANV